MNKQPFQLVLALAALTALPAAACPPPQLQLTFQEEVAQSYGRADAAFEAQVLVNELLPGPGPAGTDHIKLKVVHRYKGSPSAAALELRLARSGTTCDRSYFGNAGSRALVFSGADGRLIWTVTDQPNAGLPEARKIVEKSAGGSGG